MPCEGRRGDAVISEGTEKFETMIVESKNHSGKGEIEMPRISMSVRGMYAGVALAGLTLFASACTTGVSQAEVQQKDQQIAQLQSEVASLTTQVQDVQQDAQYWGQLTSLIKPVEMASMKDHRAFMLPTGGLIALHFDNMDLSKAENLNWLAMGVPGIFCKADQERVEQQFGPGFTHFHDMMNDTHGGAPGAQGVWFVHTAVRDFDSMMSGGPVKQGIDSNFMPTAAPVC